MTDICQRQICSFLQYFCVFGTLPVSRRFRRQFTVKITNPLSSTVEDFLFFPVGKGFFFSFLFVYRNSDREFAHFRVL